MNDSTIAEWESAYLRFESPEEELAKFRRRLRKFGADRWRRDLSVVELFCGRGSGLRAWKSLGFSNLCGVDLSQRLVGEIGTEFKSIVADARNLPFPDGSIDVVSIQGGLHHLSELPDDLEAVITECRRVLKTDGRLLVVEPWLTPFLRFVHFCCRRKAARAVWPKLDALATMIELEKATYFAWLARPELVLNVIQNIFPNARYQIAWGKLSCRADNT